MVKAKAHPKFLILKSSINLSTSITKKVFTMIANNPNVKIVNGNAKNWSIGPSKKLASEIPAATQIETQKFFICTPRSTFDVMKTEILLINQAQIIKL